jgi:tRNA(adenine34) deaminase
MGLALDEARKAFLMEEVPVGALVVQDDKILASAYNLKETLNDPTAHAEIIALRQASQKIKNWRLYNATLYVTLEPCVMCAGAMVEARLKRVVYAAADEKKGAVDSRFNIAESPFLDHRVEVIAGIREKEAKELLEMFFKTKRE